MKDIVAFFKFLIIAGIAVAFALFSYTFFDAYVSERILVPAPPPTEHEIAVAARWLEINFLIKIAFILLLMFAIFAAIMRFLVVPATNARGEFNMAENGQWKPKAMITSSLKERINPFVENKFAIIDPNEQALPVIEVRSNGHLDAQGSSGGISEQNQIALAHNVARSHSFSAMGGGGKHRGRGMTQAEAKLSAGVYDAQRNREEARTKVLEERTNAKPVAALPVPKVEISAIDGFACATDTNLPMGYTNDGRVVVWDVEQSPHVRVHGKTQGSGKTNLIKTIAAGALRRGHAVIVLDRRGFKDWAAFNDCAEMIDNRQSGVFACVAAQVEDFYRDRDAQLGSAGVGNLAALTGDHRRVFVIVSEFGTACRSQEEHHLLAVVNSLKNIFSEAGAAGVHLVFEDQVVNRSWPRELRGNADPITGYLPEDVAKGGGYTKAHELDPFQFHYEGERFRTWDMRQSAIKLLAKVPPLQSRIIDLQAVRNPVHNERTGVHNERLTNGSRTASSVANGTNDDNFSSDFRRKIKNIYERSRSWDEVGKAFFAANQHGTQSELRRLMVAISNDGRGADAFKGIAFDTYHRFSPNGNRQV